MDYENNCESFTVTKSDEIEKLLDFIHDEHFSIEDVVYDSSTKTLTVPFDRCYHWIDSKVVKNYLIFQVREVPVMKCSLVIMNVEDYTIVDKEGVVTNSFNIIEYHDKEGMIIVDTNIPTQFEIKVTSLYIRYINHGFKWKARISCGFFPIPWESGPRFLKSGREEGS